MHGNVTEYTYYNDDRLHEVIIKRDGQSDRVFTYSYDAAGRLSEILYPTSTGIKAVFDDGATPTPNPGWNENGQLTHLRYLKKDGMGVYQHFHSFVYEYDPSGNRKKFVDTPENTANKITWEYGYDWLNRLTEVKRGDGAATPTTQRIYAYDESDNRTFLDDHVNNLSLHYTYDVADQILAIRQGTLGSRDTVNDFQTVVESFTHNDDGMMTQRVLDPNGTPVTTDYTWDEFDNLVEIDGPLGTVANSYDADGIRKRKVEDDGSTLDSFYSGLPTASEAFDPAVGDPISFSYLMGHQLLGFQENGDFFYFVTDGLSSVRALVDEAGDEAAHYVHSEFGQRLVAFESGGSSPKTWVGGLSVHDEWIQAGLFYMRQRWYEPGLGRFLSQDPLAYVAGLNRYVYVDNRPVNDVDPSGLISESLREKIEKCIGVFNSLGYQREALSLALVYAPAGSSSLSSLPSFFPDEAAGFTNPITKGIGLQESHCTSLENTCTLLFHELSHALTQGRLRLLTQGILGHWLGEPISKANLELPIYERELEFVNRWRRTNGSPDLIERAGFLENNIKSLRTARDAALNAPPPVIDIKK